MNKLPKAFEALMKEQLQDQYTAYTESFFKPVWNGLRVNESKLSGSDYEKISPWKLRAVPWVRDEGFYYEDGCSPAKHPHYYAGLYYLQEPSAMTPAHVLPIEAGDRILDLCAAPGGKATQLGAKLARLSDRGFVLANDISHTRAKALLKNLELQGIANLFVTSENPRKLVEVYPDYFDKILLDAPCSGEGMFRKDPKMAAHWVEEGPDAYAPRQKELILQAFDMLRPGGMLLYSTCTFSVMENEDTIAYLLDQRADARICEIPPYEGYAAGIADDRHPGLSGCVHIYPHRMDGEGHFLALLAKEEGKACSDAACAQRSDRRKNPVLPREAADFLQQLQVSFDEGYFHMIDKQLYYLQEDMEIKKGIRYLRTGLFLGTCEKKRFEPSQALAMALKASQYPACIALTSNDERTIRYLKGETITLDGLSVDSSCSWQLVCVDGYPLGWGKLQNQTLKNKYYPGWRWQ